MSPVPGFSGFTLQTGCKVLIKALERRRLALSSHKGGGLAGDLMVGRGTRTTHSVSYWRRGIVMNRKVRGSALLGSLRRNRPITAQLDSH